MTNSIQVFAPATVANVGCGFDVLGFAIRSPGDRLILKKNNLNRIVIQEITGDGGKLSYNPELNTASVSIQALLHHVESNQGFDLWLHKQMPMGSGLGSSSASAVAGVFGANLLLGDSVHGDLTALIPFAMEGERIACGTAHADNVSPALLGGFTVVVSSNPLLVRKIPFPPHLKAVVVHPDMVLRTEDARSVLPQTISLPTAVGQWGRVAGLVTALFTNDYALISAALHDLVAEPARAALIPGFSLVKEKATQMGALGCSISGSGPSVFALCGPGCDAESVGNAMMEAFRSVGLGSQMWISDIQEQGVRVE